MAIQEAGAAQAAGNCAMVSKSLVLNPSSRLILPPVRAYGTTVLTNFLVEGLREITRHIISIIPFSKWFFP